MDKHAESVEKLERAYRDILGVCGVIEAIDFGADRTEVGGIPLRTMRAAVGQILDSATWLLESLKEADNG